MGRRTRFGHVIYGSGGYDTREAGPVEWDALLEEAAANARRHALPASVFGWVSDPREQRDYPPDIVLYFDSSGRPTKAHEWDRPGLSGGEHIRWVLPGGRRSGRYRLECHGQDQFSLRDQSGTIKRRISRDLLERHLKVGRVELEN